MIELDERDIRNVASGRYWRRKKWYALGSMVVLAVVILPLFVILSKGNWTDWFWILVPIAYSVWSACLFIWEMKERKKLIKEWKSE